MNGCRLQLNYCKHATSNFVGLRKIKTKYKNNKNKNDFSVVRTPIAGAIGTGDNHYTTRYVVSRKLTCI